MGGDAAGQYQGPHDAHQDDDDEQLDQGDPGLPDASTRASATDAHLHSWITDGSAMTTDQAGVPPLPGPRKVHVPIGTATSSSSSVPVRPSSSSAPSGHPSSAGALARRRHPDGLPTAVDRPTRRLPAGRWPRRSRRGGSPPASASVRRPPGRCRRTARRSQDLLPGGEGKTGLIVASTLPGTSMRSSGTSPCCAGRRPAGRQRAAGLCREGRLDRRRVVEGHLHRGGAGDLHARAVAWGGRPARPSRPRAPRRESSGFR